MDFQSAMETFAEAWMAANTKSRPGSSDHQVRLSSTCSDASDAADTCCVAQAGTGDARGGRGSRAADTAQIQVT